MAATQIGCPAIVVMLAGRTAIMIAPPPTSPNTKSQRQRKSSFCGLSAPPKIPHRPAIRPLNIKRRVAEIPMRTPPIADEMGVKVDIAAEDSVRYAACVRRLLLRCALLGTCVLFTGFDC